MRSLKRLLVVAGLAWATAAPALQAQTAAAGPVVDVDRWNVTAFVGPGFGADLNNSPLSVGVAGAYNFTPRLAFEAEFAYTRGAEQGVLFNLDTGVSSLSANAIYHFGTAGWVPYGAFGLGWLRGNTDLDDLQGTGLTPAQLIALGLNSDGTTNAFGVNLGGGVKRRLGDRVNFRGDLRYFSGRDLAPSFWRAYAGLGFLVGR